MANTAVTNYELDLPSPSFAEMDRSCEKLVQTDLGDTRTLACLLSQMNLRYYKDVLNQANQSFRVALVAAAVGVIFFIGAAWIMHKSDDRAWISFIPGAVVQVISGTCFYLYIKASNQFAIFHICLDRSNRFVLANTLCENLEAPERDTTRAYLVHVIAEATLLTPDVITGYRRTNHGIKDREVNNSTTYNHANGERSTT
jgi:Cyanobacterial TRADD-N associated 2-Transmembrane domain